MTARLALAATAVLALAACEQQRGVGFGPQTYGANIPEAAEVTVFDLPGVRPIPAYEASGVSGPEGAVAFGAPNLARPDANLDLQSEGQSFLLRQVTVEDVIFVVVQGGAPTASIPAEIRTRTGCLLTGTPVTVRGVPAAPSATVYALDCS